ncbi:MAG TPA: efflux RND transporter periplasmic adaptor subunit [Burkholderiaceae bacterium]|nr:efflux RND transporter periplasmic adaptor subunit [Burkholderiaceae bacterium]
MLPLSSQQQNALGVRFTEAAPARKQVLSATATVTIPAQAQFIVAAPVAGLVTRVQAALGDAVQAGQTLALLASPQIAESQRGLAEAAAQREVAADNARRDTELFDEGIIPLARLRASQARLSEANAMLAARQSELRISGNRTPVGKSANVNGNVALTSAIDGVVIEASALPGQRMDAATPLFRIARLDALTLDIALAPERAALLAVGDVVELPGRGAQGKITAVPAVVGASQTVLVHARLSSYPKTLYPGESVAVDIQSRLDPAPGAVPFRLPLSALVQTGGKNLVFIANPGGVAATPVQVLARSDDSVVVSGALGIGDRVASSGVAALKAILMEVK